MIASDGIPLTREIASMSMYLPDAACWEHQARYPAGADTERTFWLESYD